MERLEYVYLIRHENSGKFYAGCSYGKTCNPSKFWNTYFTSSKSVKEIIKLEGKGAFEVLEIIPRPLSDSREYEYNLLKSVDAAKSTKWLNKSNGRKEFGNFGSMTLESRRKMSLAKTGRKYSDEHRSNISKGGTGKTLSKETRTKMSVSRLGKTYSEETRSKISDANRNIVSKDSTKEKQSAALKGIVRSEDTRSKMSDSAKLRPILTCPHCGKTGRGAMHRWHFDRCKEKAAQ